MEETYNKWPEWQRVYVDIKRDLKGLFAPAPAAIYMYKRMKKYV